MSTAIAEREKVERKPTARTPFRNFPSFEEIEDLWNSPFGFWPRTFRRLGIRRDEWIPRTDVYEKDGNLVVALDLPGLKKEDVEVSIERDRLIIQGERKSESEVKEEDYYRMERSAGRFYRSMMLPSGTDPDQVQAEFKDGVLKVSLPKPAETKPTGQKIDVK